MYGWACPGRHGGHRCPGQDNGQGTETGRAFPPGDWTARTMSLSLPREGGGKRPRAGWREHPPLLQFFLGKWPGWGRGGSGGPCG